MAHTPDVGPGPCCRLKTPFDRTGPWTCPQCGLIRGWPCKPEPSNDGRGSDFSIKIEIRAAAIAVMPVGAFARNDEWAGWHAHDNGDSVPWDADGDEAQCWHAGYLARIIATHSETT